VKAVLRGFDLETCLRSPWRRRALIALGVLLLATASTLPWVEAFVDAGIDWQSIFLRRLLDWSLWGVALEPIVALSGRLSLWLRGRVLLLLLAHAALAVGVGFGMGELNVTLTQTFFSERAQFDRPPWRDRSSLGRDATPRSPDATSPPAPDADRPPAPAADRPPAPAAARPPAPDAAPPPTPDAARDGAPAGFRREAGSRRGRDHREAARRLGRNRRAAIGALLYALCVGLGWSSRAFLAARDQERRAAGLELRAARLEGELSSAQLAQLEAQLHPHFLFNALHSVGGLIREDRGDDALRTLAALGDLLRASLERGATAELPLREELALAEQFLEVERIRLGDRLTVSIHTEPGIGSTPMPVLALSTLVENAVLHGVAPRAEGGHIEVAARRSGDSVVVAVTDDGPGFPPDVLAGRAPDGEGAHIGLENTRARLQTLYGDAAALELSNPPGGGACARLRLPARPSTGEEERA